MSHYLHAMRRYFEFSGRSSRSEFWFFVLFVVILNIVASMIDSFILADGDGGIPILSSVVSLVHIIPGLAVSVRRLHDINRTGWWVLLGLVPAAAMMVLMGGSMMLMLGGSDMAGAVGAGAMGMSMGIVWLLNLVVLIVLLVFYCTRGTPGPNRFGPLPSGIRTTGSGAYA